MKTFKFLLLVKKKSHCHNRCPSPSPDFWAWNKSFCVEDNQSPVQELRLKDHRSITILWVTVPTTNFSFPWVNPGHPFPQERREMETKLLISMGHCLSYKYYYFILPPCTKKSLSPHKFCNMSVFLPKMKWCNNVEMVQPPTPQTLAFHQKKPLWSQVQNRLLLAVSIMMLAARTPRAAESRVGQCSLLGWGRCWGTEIIWGFLLTRASMRTSAPSSLSWRVSISVSSCSKSTTAMETCAGC